MTFPHTIHQKKGFTLLEVMIAMLVGSIILLFIAGILTSGRQNAQIQDQLETIHQKGTNISNLFKRMFRNFGSEVCMPVVLENSQIFNDLNPPTPIINSAYTTWQSIQASPLLKSTIDGNPAFRLVSKADPVSFSPTGTLKATGDIFTPYVIATNCIDQAEIFPLGLNPANKRGFYTTHNGATYPTNELYFFNIVTFWHDPGTKQIRYRLEGSTANFVLADQVETFTLSVAFSKDVNNREYFRDPTEEWIELTAVTPIPADRKPVAFKLEFSINPPPNIPANNLINPQTFTAIANVRSIIQ